MLLAEELALVAIKPDTGRHALGMRSDLNACLAGLLVAGHLLEVVAPDKSTRKHARRRIDHALDDSNLQGVGKVVRRLIEEAATAASTAAIVGSTAAIGGA